MNHLAIGFVNLGKGGIVCADVELIHHKSMKYILKDTIAIRHNNDEVYLIDEITEEMSRMNSANFYETVRKNGIRLFNV